MTTRKKQLIKAFTNNAITGGSKIGAITSYKKAYDLNDNQIEWLIEACNFKNKPKVNYEAFYNCEINKKAKKINSKDAQIYYIDNFLTEIDCQLLSGYISENAKRATLHKAGGKDERIISDKRTSSETFLSYQKHPYFNYIDQKLCQAMNFYPSIGEIIHGQKYEIGEYYKIHGDFFRVGEDFDTYCDWMGQRTWTTMLYLNNVEEGGETHFPELNLKLKPKEGTLLAWNNLHKDGSPNEKTKHEALPPKSGKKYIITKWWRSWSLI
jgi:prolyl 4-hydroxylase